LITLFICYVVINYPFVVYAIKVYMNIEKKRRLADLLRSLMGDQSQSAFSKVIGIHQSALSGYLNPKDDSRTPAKATDDLIVKYLQKTYDPKWSLQELQNYLDSDDSFQKFTAKLARRSKPVDKMTVESFVENLSDEEMLDAVSFIADRLKKNCYLTSSCA